MSSILMSGLTGLEAMQQLLNVSGNNIANSDTTGFKAQSVEFSDLLYQTINQPTAATSNSGGTNPAQIGSGVQVASITTNQQQGTLEATGNQYGVALQGSGYFVVNNGTQDLYTRAGNFGVNSQGYLVDPATGDMVQRFGSVGEGTATSPAFQTAGNDNIKIPTGAQIPGNATSTITMQGNLSASATGPLAQVLTSSQPFLATGGTPATSTTLLNSLADNTTPYVTGDTLTIQGTTASGTAVNTTLSVGPTTTMNDILNAINSNFPGSTATLSATGNLVITANSPGPSSLAVTLSDTPGDTGATTWSNHTLAVTTAGKNGDTTTTGIQFYDAQGTPYTLTVTFQKQANGTWNMTGSIPAAAGTMVSSTISGITFNANGSIAQVSGAGGASMTVALTGQATPQTLNFNLGTNGSFSGLTELGTTSSATATQQNGYGPGTLSSVSIDATGVISGVFSNGQVLQIAQLAVASFANPQGLSLQGNNYYALTSQSGTAVIGAANQNGVGAVQQGQLEDSNVDVSLEFTKLIIAQRGFEMNAHAISAGDTVLQDLTNIVH